MLRLIEIYYDIINLLNILFSYNTLKHEVEISINVIIICKLPLLNDHFSTKSLIILSMSGLEQGMEIKTYTN